MADTINAVPSQKGLNAFKRKRIFATVVTYAAAILAVLCLIGLVVSVLMLNIGEKNAQRDFILYVLTGCFVGGAVGMAACTYFLAKLMSRASYKELDFRERLDGEESFFVGEGTLLTFGESGITLHAEKEGGNKPVFVPYDKTRYISICTRRRPREKGDWCVAIEIPIKYLSKNAEEKEGEKVLVQADAKDRLYRALEKHNLTLFGERREENKPNQKFTPVQRFSLPNRRKRKTALIMLVVGIVLIGGAIPFGLLVHATIGALLGAVGLVLTLRGGVSLVKAKAVFGVYKEGIFWRESSGGESLFLKWEDIEGVSLEEQKGFPVLVFRCDYGKYAIPAVEGAYECIEGYKEGICQNQKQKQKQQ